MAHAIFFYRKFVFRTLYNIYKSSKCEIDSDSCSSVEVNTVCQQKKTRLENDHNVLEQKEIDCVDRVQKKCGNVFQRKLAQRYIEWIKKAVIK